MVKFRVGDVVDVDYHGIHKNYCIITAFHTIGPKTYAFLSNFHGGVPIKNLRLTDGEFRIRDELFEFMQAMEKKLRERDEKYGDSWKRMTPIEIDDRLTQEIVEWDEHHDPNETIDIANVCMMVWYNFEHDKVLPKIVADAVEKVESLESKPDICLHDNEICTEDDCPYNYKCKKKTHLLDIKQSEPIVIEGKLTMERVHREDIEVVCGLFKREDGATNLSEIQTILWLLRGMDVKVTIESFESSDKLKLPQKPPLDTAQIAFDKALEEGKN